MADKQTDDHGTIVKSVLHADVSEPKKDARSSHQNSSRVSEKKLELPRATLEALKTLSSINSSEGIGKLSNCDKLTASLEQIRANRNIKLFEKLDKIRQDFKGLNNQIAQMEESIIDLREVTSDLVRSLPPDRELSEGKAKY